MHEDNLAIFIIGAAVGVAVTSLLWFSEERRYEKECEEFHNVFDCERKEESYEPMHPVVKPLVTYKE